MDSYVKFFEAQVGYMPFGTLCNCLMAIIDQTNAAMPFVITAHPSLWTVPVNHMPLHHKISGFIPASLGKQHACYVSSSDYAMSMNLSIYVWLSMGMLDEFGELTKVAIYPACSNSLWRVVVIVTPIQGLIDTGCQATQLTYKQLKHTNSRCPR